jgi:hypothetical protein
MCDVCRIRLLLALALLALVAGSALAAGTTASAAHISGGTLPMFGATRLVRRAYAASPDAQRPSPAATRLPIAASMLVQ